MTQASQPSRLEDVGEALEFVAVIVALGAIAGAVALVVNRLPWIALGVGLGGIVQAAVLAVLGAVAVAVGETRTAVTVARVGTDTPAASAQLT